MSGHTQVDNLRDGQGDALNINADGSLNVSLASGTLSANITSINTVGVITSIASGTVSADITSINTLGTIANDVTVNGTVTVANGVTGINTVGQVTSIISGTIADITNNVGSKRMTSIEAVVPADGTAVDYDAIYVGVGDDVNVRLADGGGTAILYNVPSGRIIEGAFIRVLATSTDASAMAGLNYG